MANLNSDLSLKLAALLAALAAISIEDFAAIKAAGVLGDDAIANITNLQNLSASIDDETIAALNAERQAAGLAPL